MAIKSHRGLAEHIAGKKVLHLNSLGKDSLVCLEWLTNYARPSEVVSVHFEFGAKHPDDARYFRYLGKRFPDVGFISEPNGADLTNIVSGSYQSPITVMDCLNHFEFGEFSMAKQAKEVKEKHGCDFICIGDSKYESVARATYFYHNGLCVDDRIYPLGLLTKDQVIGVILHANLKVHPIYKLMQSTPDYPSYYKMRAAMIASREYREQVLKTWPLLELDRYRYERLFKGIV